MLQETLLFENDPHGKFKPNYEGPYLVIKEVSGEGLSLSKVDEDVLPEPFNFDAVKRYFV